MRGSRVLRTLGATCVLALLSLPAWATPIAATLVFDPLTPAGSLTVMFAGLDSNSTGTVGTLEFGELTSFTATITGGPADSTSWDLSGLTGFLFDIGSDALVGLSAIDFDTFRMLDIGDAVFDSNATVIVYDDNLSPLLDVVVIPLPSTMALFALGLIGLGYRRRRSTGGLPPDKH